MHRCKALALIAVLALGTAQGCAQKTVELREPLDGLTPEVKQPPAKAKKAAARPDVPPAVVLFSGNINPVSVAGPNSSANHALRTAIQGQLYRAGYQIDADARSGWRVHAVAAEIEGRAVVTITVFRPDGSAVGTFTHSNGRGLHDLREGDASLAGPLVSGAIPGIVKLLPPPVSSL